MSFFINRTSQAVSCRLYAEKIVPLLQCQELQSDKRVISEKPNNFLYVMFIMEGPEEIHLPNLIEIAVKTRSYSNIIINYKLRLS